MRVRSGIGIRPRVWLVVTVACAAVVTGCGSASTGQISPDAVINTVQSFAGPNPKVYSQDLLIKRVDGYHWMRFFIACKPEGGCLAVAPDGAGYTDLQEFVDDSKLVKPGDVVDGPTEITKPGSPQSHARFTKRVIPPWVWFVGGSALLVLLVVGALWRQVRTRRRRVNE